jgi:GNAT superfamily N-acetyltransferase
MVTIRGMTPDDVPLGMRLKAQASWNQTTEDWRMLLEAGAGWVAVVDGCGVGTATVVPYDETFAWIGMVLVDSAYRRRGIGTALLETAIEQARRHGAARLDATPQGRPLYARLGFEVEAEIVRMVRPATGHALSRSTAPVDLRCLPITVDALPELMGYDIVAFGAPRTGILEALRVRAPAYAYYALRDGVLAGYCLGRSGSGLEQIGPVVADDVETAQALLRAALSHVRDRGVIVDVPAVRPAWFAHLATLGFERRRAFTRMYLSGDGAFGYLPVQYAVAGPEIG